MYGKVARRLHIQSTGHVPAMAKPAMVSTTSRIISQPHLHFAEKPTSISSMEGTQSANIIPKYLQPSRRSALGRPDHTTQLPPHITSVINAGIRKSTQTCYHGLTKTWFDFCSKWERDTHSPSVRDILDYLHYIAKKSNFRRYTARYFKTKL